jgi:hypothetical protein
VLDDHDHDHGRYLHALSRAVEEITLAEADIRRLRARNQGIDPAVYLRVAGRLTLHALCKPGLSPAVIDARLDQARRIAARASGP